MPARTDLRSGDDGEPEASPCPAVSACTTSPDRVVFIESGNTDGWIATDLVLEPRC